MFQFFKLQEGQRLKNGYYRGLQPFPEAWKTSYVKPFPRLLAVKDRPPLYWYPCARYLEQNPRAVTCRAENMKFILETVSPRGVRMGRIMVNRDGRELPLPTPTCLSHTNMGHFPYLTPDLMDKVSHRPNGILLSSSTL